MHIMVNLICVWLARTHAALIAFTARLTARALVGTARLLTTSDLGVISEIWTGFRLHSGLLWRPEDMSLTSSLIS